MFRRTLVRPLLAALADTPAVFLHGPRQSGKTTLARAVAEGEHPAAYLTLDDAPVLAAARHDPEGFVARLPRPVVLDEVQLAPELFRAIKVAIDRQRQPGSFLLTGSAHLLVLPRLASSLVGRMEVLRLGPLSQGEIEGREEGALGVLFGAGELPAGSFPVDRGDLLARVARGGYPEVVQRAGAGRRAAWFDSYVTTLLQRDVRDLANIDGLSQLPDLLRLLAARSATLLNLAELGRTSGLPRTTLKRYLALLEGIFLLQRIPAWSTNLSKRLARAPKAVLGDSGLLCHLLGLDAERLTTEPVRLGPILESFVLGELSKQMSWSPLRLRLHHYRHHDGGEVDVVLEDAAGRLVGLEVKARATITGRDFRSLRQLADLAGERFHRGVVLHTGATAVPFGDRFHALPIPWLWQG